MKTALIIYLIGLPAMFFCLATNHRSEEQKTIDDWKEMGLKDRVKALTETGYRLVKTPKGPEKQYQQRLTILFNEQGRKIEETTIEYKSNFTKRNCYIYDNDNKLAEIRTYNADSALVHIWTLTYDNKKNKIEEAVLNADKSPNAKYFYKYDSSGRKIEMNGYNMKTGGNHFITETYKYDNSGNIMEEKTSHASGGYTRKYKYTLDNKGRITEKHGFDSYEKSDNYEYKIVYKYDDAGNVIEEKHSNPNNRNPSTTTIVADKKNNWIKRINIQSNEVTSITEREIEYFQ